MLTSVRPAVPLSIPLTPALSPPRTNIPPAVRVSITFAFLLAFASLVSFELEHSLRPSHLFTLFQLGGEQNFGTWFSVIQLATIGLLHAAFAHAMTARRISHARLLYFPAALFLYLSADEALQLHEYVGHALQRRLHLLTSPDGSPTGPFHKTGYWMLLLVPPFLLITATLAHLTRPFWQNRRRPCLLLTLGLALFLSSAAGLESLGNLVPEGRAENLITTLEELGEMLAASLFLWGTLALLSSHNLHPLTPTP